MVVVVVERVVLIAVAAAVEVDLVSWCFEPSQPQRITSGLCRSRRSSGSSGSGNSSSGGKPSSSSILALAAERNILSQL